MNKKIKKISSLKLLIMLIKFFVPLIGLILKFAYSNVKYGYIFIGYIIFIILERMIETFYSGNSRRNFDKIEEDWTFQAVALTYTVMVLIMIFEFFMVPRKFELLLVFVGSLIFVIAFCFRFWGMKTLGELWQTKSSMRELITNLGPYRYMRHPIYFGLILEVIAVPLIAGTYYALLFSFVIFAPLILLKVHLEEKYLFELYGNKYQDYARKRFALLPLPKINKDKK